MNLSKRLNCFSEPTSVTKSRTILDAMAILDGDVSMTDEPIVSYASPNLRELANMLPVIAGDPTHPPIVSSPRWKRIELDIPREEALRGQLQELTDVSLRNDLTSLITEGVALTALRLLPLFKTLIVQCGERGTVELV